jgi:hypothetical protein
MPDKAPNAPGWPPGDAYSGSNEKIGGSGAIESKISTIRARLLELKAEHTSLEATLANLQRELSALDRTETRLF